jgi:hypothetical protein
MLVAAIRENVAIIILHGLPRMLVTILLSDSPR